MAISTSMLPGAKASMPASGPTPETCPANHPALSGTSKIGQALALTTFVILDALGFQAQAHHNSPSALAGLQAMFVGLPVLLSLASAFVILGYRLDSGRHAEIRNALARTDLS